MESPSGNVGLDSGAFLLTNQIVAYPITGVPHWCPSASGDANW